LILNKAVNHRAKNAEENQGIRFNTRTTLMVDDVSIPVFAFRRELCALSYQLPFLGK
jgi:hypothetical protein